MRSLLANQEQANLGCLFPKNCYLFPKNVRLLYILPKKIPYQESSLPLPLPTYPTKKKTYDLSSLSRILSPFPHKI